MSYFTSCVSGLVIILALTGCSSKYSKSGKLEYVYRGEVINISPENVYDENSIYAPLVLGAGGAIIGSSFGKGDRNILSSMAGASLGLIAGGILVDNTGKKIDIRLLRNNRIVSVTLKDEDIGFDLNAGDIVKVYVEDNEILGMREEY